MAVFLPYFDSSDSSLLPALSRLGPVLYPESSLPARVRDYFVLADEPDLETVVAWLDKGADKVVLPIASLRDIALAVPPERLILLIDVGSVHAVTDRLRESVSGVVLKTPEVDPESVASVSRFFVGKDIYVWSTAPPPPTPAGIRSTDATHVIPTSKLTLASTTDRQLNIIDAFLSPINTDRPDGLYPTIVSSWTQGGKSLGLAYSSTESIRQAITSGKGVYQSRKHGLWKKGETSGDTQDIVKVRLDCDSDCLEFSVIQHGNGFCHLNRPSCFGHLSGLYALEKTLQSRLDSAPEGSYTSRLFNDSSLLNSKIMEEADELCKASGPQDVAFEAADLIYFVLTRCVAAGVRVADIEHSLDLKSKKVTRRPGNAKPQWIQQSDPKPPLPTAVTPVDPNDQIRMQTTPLNSITPEQRAKLLKRPVMRSEEIFAKVKPIVDAVRTRGDAALLELTEKLDKVAIKSLVMKPPFPKEAMLLDEKVKHAIEVAYANIRKFHEAQITSAPLVVETMEGVTCTRFSRPIARVGLYVPGGTAILPSTALMLGVPAQVAGCKEIVLATPPRPDGSISPEVLFVANLVGASTVLLAGGGQAVAAMAYGTESVPKVDKIFGPGNQWVTAAKMLVQNDMDALVSIDMPAGPSEVLVIADHTADPSFVAADLLSQAEHGVDSQVVLVTVKLPQGQVAIIEDEVDKQAHALPRVNFIRESIRKSIIVQADSLEQAITFSNDYAPEHLILHVDEAKKLIPLIENAGSVFVGPHTPESCGDYASGTNHTLPTNGFARQFSGVNTQSFQKHITSQEITEEGLKRLGPIVTTLAECEGLQAHANAVHIRLSKLA